MGQSINWDPVALAAFAEAMDFIAARSPASAKKLASAISEAVSKAAGYLTSYPPDKYRIDGNLQFREFEIISFRISYFVAPEGIAILRFRHVRQFPERY